MTKRIAIVFVAILTLLIVGWLLIGKKEVAPKPKSDPFNYLPSPAVNPATVATASAKIEQVDVGYTDTGFDPAKITIKKGGAVVFYNKSKGEMFIKSDLPEFNQIIEGKVYAYTFNKVGSWSFQNQKHPTHLGTITVTE